MSTALPQIDVAMFKVPKKKKKKEKMRLSTAVEICNKHHNQIENLNEKAQKS